MAPLYVISFGSLGFEVQESLQALFKCCLGFTGHWEQELKLLGRQNLSAFYHFVKSKLKLRDSILPLFDSLGNLLVEDVAQANFLNEAYSSVFVNWQLLFRFH